MSQERLGTRWPESLASAMLCQGCGAAVDWQPEDLARTGDFTCPQCGTRRPSHNASPQLRRKTAERDGWFCHRCSLPIDPALSWPHPLSLTADHYPVSRRDGGPPILANLRAAHSLCNGSNGPVGMWLERPDQYLLTGTDRWIIRVISTLPRDASDHIRPGSIPDFSAIT